MRKNKCTKGIILAAGRGSRLYPMTGLTNKQLLPVYNKPTIYFPLTTLMLAGINKILIICPPKDLDSIKKFLKDGSQWNINIDYKTQEQPNGIPEAFTIGEKFIADDPVALILGDNVFHGQGFSTIIENVADNIIGAHLFAFVVRDPRRYGVVVLDDHGKPTEIEEKPENPKTHYAVTGLYFYDNQVVELSKKLTPSFRGELEITDLNKIYIQNNNAQVHTLGRGFVWFDVGTPESLAHASQYVQILEERQDISIASPEEVAWRMKLIDDQQLKILATNMPKSSYSKYILDLLNNNNQKIYQSDLSQLKRRKRDI